MSVAILELFGGYGCQRCKWDVAYPRSGQSAADRVALRQLLGWAS